MPIDIYIDRASEKLSSISFYFPYIQWRDTQNDFYINGCLPLFKKRWFWSPNKSPSHSDSSHWGFAWSPMPGNANTASRSAWGFMNPVGLVTGWFNGMGSLPTAPAGQSSWQRKEPQQIAWVFWYRCFRHHMALDEMTWNHHMTRRFQW